jgi:SM-20-related protein
MSTPFLSEQQIVEITDALGDTGMYVGQGVVSDNLVTRWRTRTLSLHAHGALRPAAIGRAAQQAVTPHIRSDAIAWIDEQSDDIVDRSALDFIEHLRGALNERLYLSLDHSEMHFVLYPPGGHYRKHLDRHRDAQARVVSFVLYLNASWQSHWGGQLKLYDFEDRLLRSVEPCAGTLVLFRSELFPHEVIAATHNRTSLTGWLRRRA